jgi:hypothetical protein
MAGQRQELKHHLRWQARRPCGKGTQDKTVLYRDSVRSCKLRAEGDVLLTIKVVLSLAGALPGRVEWHFAPSLAATQRLCIEPQYA